MDFKDEICKILDESSQIFESDYKNKNISINLRIFITYDENDNLKNVSDLIMDLDPTHNIIVLSFEYSLSYNDYKNMKLKYDEHISVSTQDEQIKLNVSEFLSQEYKNYFVLNKLSLGYDYEEKKVNDSVSINIKEAKIDLSNVINFKLISAKRDVANKDNSSTLSRHAAIIYKNAESNSNNEMAIGKFKNNRTYALTTDMIL